MDPTYEKLRSRQDHITERGGYRALIQVTRSEPALHRQELALPTREVKAIRRAAALAARSVVLREDLDYALQVP